MDQSVSELLAVDGVHIDGKTQESFIKAFDEMAPRLYRFAILRVSSRPLAEDLVEDAFLKTWQYLNRGGKVKSYPVFLYKVLKNLIVDYWRSKSSAEVPINEEIVENFAVSDNLNNLSNSISNSMEVEQVVNALKNLTPAEAEVLEYRFVQELSIREIAALTGKKPNAIYVSIWRGVRNLRKKLEGHV